MTPEAFVSKWQRIEAKERTIAQTHFNELCDLLGVPKPLDVDAKGDFYTFEKPVEKVTGGPVYPLLLAHETLDKAVYAAYSWEYPLSDEVILEQLLALNLERAAKQENV